MVVERVKDRFFAVLGEKRNPIGFFSFIELVNNYDAHLNFFLLFAMHSVSVIANVTKLSMALL